jgi:lambda family phage tail tape measure protein
MSNDTTVLQVKLDDLGTIEKIDNKLKKARGTFDSFDKQVSKGLGGGKGSSGWKKATMGTTEYDIARGSAGATGASGRDFANQARGLDGLVRLYATYAANVFAAGAAFRALSDAADTSNMVQGMNQLGAASGTALGTIAQNLRNATDGAISMREAMEATTKGTAAGLSGKQMELLGAVANKASKALGIGMPDAISRLTRGISKLEPELLDELGLFTKIGPATEDYARSIGKATGSLTDFERRQAFANAVLKEGMDKFSSIDIPANPYDKLLASLKDLSFVALEITNKAFVPLVNILSQNPVALLGVLAAIGASIIKSAIPALGQYRDNLKKTADASRMAFSTMYSDQQEKIGMGAAAAGAAAEKAYRKSAATQSRIQELSKNGAFSKTNKTDYAALAAKDPFALTAAEIKSLDRRANDLAKRNSEEATRLKAHIAELKAIRAGAEMANTNVQAVVLANRTGLLSTDYSNEVIQKRTLNKLASDSIRSTTAETQAIYGARTAYTKLNDEIKKARAGQLMVQTGTEKNGDAIMKPAPYMSAFQAGLTRTAGLTGIVVQKIGSLISAFGVWGMAIGALVGAFALLDSWLTKTEKEADAFNKAIKTTSDAVDNSARTLAALAKQPGIATASIQGFFALSNASNTTTDAIETQIQTTKDLLKALDNSGWDRAINNIKGLFDKDANSESAKNLAATVQQQLQLFRAAGMGDEAEASFKKALGVNSLDLTTVAARFKISTKAQDEFQISNKALAVRLAESSARLQSFKTATENVTKAYDEFIQSTANSNPLFKIGAALTDLSLNMDDLTKGSLHDLNAAFNDLATTPRKIAQFGPEFVEQFVAIRAQFKATLQDYTAYGQSLAAVQDQITTKTEEFIHAKDPTFWGIGPQEQGSAQEQRDKLGGEIRGLKNAEGTLLNLQLGIDKKVFQQATELFGKGVDISFKQGAKYIDIALGQASQKAALTIAQATVQSLSGAEAAARTGELKGTEITIQIEAIKTTMQLIRSNMDLELVLQEVSDRIAVQDAKDAKKSPGTIAELEAKLAGTRNFREVLANNPTGMIKLENLSSRDPDNPQYTRNTNDPQIKYEKNYANKLNNLLGPQLAALILKNSEQGANSLDTKQKVNLGELANAKQIADASNATLQQEIAREDILMSINTLNASENLAKKQMLEMQVLDSKFLLERRGYETAITNAEMDDSKRGRDEVKKQELLLAEVIKRQEKEKDNKGVDNRIKLKAQELAQATTLNSLNEAILDQDIARLGIISSLLGFSSEQNVQATAKLENEKLENKFVLERKKVENEIDALKTNSPGDAKSIALAEKNLELVKARQEKEKDNKGLQDALKLIEARFTVEQKLAGFKKTTADAQSGKAEDELNYRKALNLVTPEAAAKEKADLDRASALREFNEGQSNVNNVKEKRDLARKNAEVDELGIMTNVAQIESMTTMNKVIDAQSESFKAVYDQKLAAADQTENLASKMNSYAGIVHGAFQSMGDALAEFARTGKLDFKGLVDQMLMDLIRFELRAQMSALYGGMNGLSGMMTSAAAFFTATPVVPAAKGAVYDTGLQTYAKGGMFTNSVVDQPTLFKFAQGTGLMGEAGPEAIMPLKRDNQGNLGVRGGGSNVDVVINNYSTEKATTKETMDSRGNRRIEVMVGDMVAGELNRVGSNTQQAMTTSYGTTPLLARR